MKKLIFGITGFLSFCVTAQSQKHSDKAVQLDGIKFTAKECEQIIQAHALAVKNPKAANTFLDSTLKIIGSKRPEIGKEVELAASLGDAIQVMRPIQEREFELRHIIASLGGLQPKPRESRWDFESRTGLSLDRIRALEPADRLSLWKQALMMRRKLSEDVAAVRETFKSSKFRDVVTMDRSLYSDGRPTEGYPVTIGADPLEGADISSPQALRKAAEAAWLKLGPGTTLPAVRDWDNLLSQHEALANKVRSACQRRKTNDLHISEHTLRMATSAGYGFSGYEGTRGWIQTYSRNNLVKQMGTGIWEYRNVLATPKESEETSDGEGTVHRN